MSHICDKQCVSFFFAFIRNKKKKDVTPQSVYYRDGKGPTRDEVCNGIGVAIPAPDDIGARVANPNPDLHRRCEEFENLQCFTLFTDTFLGSLVISRYRLGQPT